MPKTITKKSSTPFRYTAIGLCLVVLHMLDVQVVHDKSYELLVCWTCFTAVNRIMKDAHNLIHITAQPCDFNGNTNRTLHMEVVDNASDENNENTRRKATVVPIKIEYV